jgi:hypothetical protein
MPVTIDQSAVNDLFDTGGPIDAYIEQLAGGIQDQAAVQAPRSGRAHTDGTAPLADSIITVKVGPASWQVVAESPHALFVHEGTRPHPIDVVRAKVLMDVETGEVFGVHVDHPGTEANPFLVRAMTYVITTS